MRRSRLSRLAALEVKKQRLEDDAPKRLDDAVNDEEEPPDLGPTTIGGSPGVDY